MRKLFNTHLFDYVDTPERRVLTLERDDISCVPILGYSHYSSCRPTLSEHIHPGCLELSFCLRGSLVFECGGKEYPLFPGNVFVTQPEERHHLSSNPKGLVMYWLFFRFGPTSRPVLHLPSAESDALRQSLRTLPNRLFKGSERMRLAFQELFRLYDEVAPGPFRSLAMRGTTLDLLLALIKAARTEPARPENVRLARLIEAMRQHPECDYSLDYMTRKTALSESRLSAHFKQLTGMPPYTFLLGCRLRAAQRHLRNTTTSITEIAESLGFFSSQHFAGHFKRAFGITPTDWRNGEIPVIRSF
jgi:AraC-like DNA-binding protein